MKKIPRRSFLEDSLLLMSSAIFLSSSSLKLRGKTSLENEENSTEYPSYLNLERKGTFSQLVEKLYSIYESCNLCPRDCRVNRKEGQVGRCQATSRAKISSATPGFDEEAPLVGKGGSGMIFFSNCGLRSVYSPDYKISIEGEGIEISDQRLAEEMTKLQKKGCHNINLVTPTQYAPNVVSAIQKASSLGLRIPVVYNTRGYEKQETLQLLDGIIDIYLSECKYMDSEQAGKYSAEAYNYPHHAKLALKEMYRQVGDLKLDSRGIAIRGLMVRHLILPNRIAGTEKFLKFVAENISKTTYINIMNQYQPRYKASEYPEISRHIKRSEYDEAIKWAKKYGLTCLAK